MLLAFIALTLWAGPVWAQALVAAADASGTWLLSPEPDRPGVFTLLHRAHGDPATQINKVQTLRGDVMPQCVAAREHSLWIIYPGGEVQVFSAEPSILQDGWTYRTRVEPSLPPGVSVRATAVTAAGPWALVRVQEGETLRELDAMGVIPPSAGGDEASNKRKRNLAIGMPPGYGIEDKKESVPPAADPDAPRDASGEAGVPPRGETPQAGQASKPAALELPVDRLLRLERGRWRVHPLPEDWPHGAKTWLVTEDNQAGRPTLVARASGRAERHNQTVHVYQQVNQDAAHWRQLPYTFEAGPDRVDESFIGVESQLVCARFAIDAELLRADLSVLRGGNVLPVGRMELRDVSPSDWALLGTGNAATLIARPADEDASDSPATGHLRFQWTRLDVRGKTVLDQAGLAVKVHSAMDDLMRYIMLVFIAVLVTVLMLAFWRRDASWNRLALPESLVVADLGRRAVAAAIDLAPGMLGTMFHFGLNFEELILRWPGNGVANTLGQVTPGCIVIAAFVAHTTISELFFARTLGKSITGLRTTALDGSRPRAWQLLVRGLLKILDLIPGAWLLLMLPVIAPHRQRLGDLVGRTVVVSDAPPAEEDKDSEDPGDWSD